MPQSPRGPAAPEPQIARYKRAWWAINAMLMQGRSFSGNERNCCFLNLDGKRFVDVSAATGLDLIDDARAVAVTDFDRDGDLDLWVTNRTGPRVRLLRNDSPSVHHHLAVHLTGKNCNRDAIGARLELYLADGPHRKLIKTLRAGEGYLAQSSKWIHFGIGSATRIERLVVHWPVARGADGREVFTGLEIDHRYRIVQGSGRAEPLSSPGQPLPLAARRMKAPAPVDRARVVLLGPTLLPALHFRDLDGKTATTERFEGRAVLLNVWASWCRPCLKELNEWASRGDELRGAGLEVVAVCVDPPSGDGPGDLANLRALAGKWNHQLSLAIPDKKLVETLDVVQRSMIGRQRPLPVPASFLIDREGRLAVIYKGPVSVDQLLEDLQLLGAPAERLRDEAVALRGIWISRTDVFSRETEIVGKFLDGGFAAEAEQYLRRSIGRKRQEMQRATTAATAADKKAIGVLCALLGALLIDRGQLEQAAVQYEQALSYDPSHQQLRAQLASAMLRSGKLEAAAAQLGKLLNLDRDDPRLLYHVGLALKQDGQSDKAIEYLAQSAQRDPQNPNVHFELARAYSATGKSSLAARHYRTALRLRPQWPTAANNLAWLLATDNDPAVRRGDEAVKLAQAAVAAWKDQHPTAWDTLGAAYAEAGQFDRAVQAAAKAIELASKAGLDDLLADLQTRLQLYRSGQAFRKPVVVDQR